MKTTTIGIIVLVLAGLVILFTMGSGSKIEPAFKVGEVHPLDHKKGNASSTVLLVEYSDFECPACRSYYPILREVMQTYGDRITFVYRNYPLIAIHQNAEFAARAAEAAGKQGKFWEMHDLLFEKQNEWAKVADISKVFESYSTLLQLNVEQFKTDWMSKEVKDFVREQRIHAVKSGLQGTPTFFLNGKKIENPSSVQGFNNLINQALKK